jgi:hypothetical protein
LEACGLVIHNGSFHGPSVGNLKGNFEDKEFVDIHARELKSKYPDSKGWQVFSPDKLTFSIEHRHQLEDLTRERSRKYELWGWKDPRSVFFLDEWKKMIPKLKVLFLWRPCGEVVRSLSVRSSEAKHDVYKVGNIKESLMMWVTYNTLVLRHIRRYPDDSILFRTHDIISNNRKCFSKVNEFTGNQLSYTDLMEIFETDLFGNKSMDHGDYSDQHISIESLHRELSLLSKT